MSNATPTRPADPADLTPPDRAYLTAPRTPSDLCAAFAAELRPFLRVLEVMPEPRVLNANHFETYTKVNGRLATLVWKVTVSMRGELLSCDIDSLTVDGIELPTDLVTDDEVEFAQNWASENGDAFPVEGR